MAAQPETVRQLEAAGQLLLRKAELEAKYLDRLEGGARTCCLIWHKRASPWLESVHRSLADLLIGDFNA